MGRDQSRTPRPAPSGPARNGKRGSRPTKALGMTASGRILAVVFTISGDAIRPIYRIYRLERNSAVRRWERCPRPSPSRPESKPRLETKIWARTRAYGRLHPGRCTWTRAAERACLCAPAGFSRIYRSYRSNAISFRRPPSVMTDPALQRLWAAAVAAGPPVPGSG
jgi:hypothetical protein